MKILKILFSCVQMWTTHMPEYFKMSKNIPEKRIWQSKRLSLAETRQFDGFFDQVVAIQQYFDQMIARQPIQI